MDLLFTVGVSDAFFQAVCRVLVHSLWQGIIAAVLAAIIISCSKRSASSVRYNLLVAVLFLFVVSISVTGYSEFRSGQRTGNPAAASAITRMPYFPVNFGTNEALAAAEGGQQNLLSRFTVFCNEHAVIIVTIWFLIFLVKCSQLVTGIRYIQKLRHRNNREAGPYWKNRLKELAQQTGIRHTILLLESELVKIPAAIGFLKPVLLVPAGLLSQLPPEQVEAILIHELAHIRRRDFLVNLLQSLIETVFFFNPAIAWISSLIRQEREACCDDMVIALIPQKASYLQALVSFQELHIPKTAAMALTGNQQYLFNRVRRMLTRENKKLNLMEKTVLLVSIIGMTAFGFITKDAQENPVPAPPVQTEIRQPVTRQLPATDQVLTTKKPAVKKNRPSAVSLQKHEKDTIPKTTAAPSQKRTFPSISSNTNNDGNSMVSMIEATDDAGKTYRIKRTDGKITELAVNGTVIPSSQYGEYEEVISQIDETQRQRILKKKEDVKRKQADVAAKRKDVQEKRIANSKAVQKERNEKMNVRNKMASRNNEKRVEDRKLLQQKMESRKKVNDVKRVELKQKLKEVRVATKSNDDVSRILADLNSQKLVTDPGNLSFNLTSNELVVNGKRQPAAVHLQFKEKYIQNNGDRFKYSKHGNTTNITINREAKR